MRNKRPEEPKDDIPFWFITYSDVITLLMTFFILLLTFATNEPEMFERMQISVFGGAGATGIAGPSTGGIEMDALVHRVRPRSGRMTTRGSEMPAINEDPSLKSLAEGIAALDEDPRKTYQTSHAFRMPLPLVIGNDLKVTAIGRQRLRMVARQLQKAPFELQIRVQNANDLPKAVRLAEHLAQSNNVEPSKIGIGLQSGGGRDASLELVLTRRHES